MKNFPISMPSLTDKETDYVSDAVRSGWVSSLGAYIEKFEKKFAEYCDCPHAVAVSNGTTGLHLALVALGIGPGDEVIVPDLSFIATANVVRHAGAHPVFIDIDPETLCLDPARISAAVTPRTKAIIPVHLYGHPAKMDAINSVAKKHGLKVIEDAAEAHGATLNGKRVGGLGDCGVFSFYGNKIITCGEGGLITTHDDALANRLRFLRDHAMSKEKRYWHEEVGFNYRITNLQAALGVAQMERIEELLEKRFEILGWYREFLGTVPGVRLNRASRDASSVPWVLCVEAVGLGEGTRSTLMGMLKKDGIDTRPYFYPMSDMPMYSRANTPVSHAYAIRGLNLPLYIGLEKGEVREICAKFVTALDRVLPHEHRR